MNDLLDTTEMYLKTIYELIEEGVPPLRARIVERLSQSGPTVSETVARLERDGLIVMKANREMSFTSEGYIRAAGVMRRHRLAELMLVNVVNMPWSEVHNEACRWEHAMSNEVAERISAMLGHPTRDPFGNPVPSSDPQPDDVHCGCDDGLIALDDPAVVGQKIKIERIAEVLQVDSDSLDNLRELGLVPQAEGSVESVKPSVVELGDVRIAIPDEWATHIFVSLQ
ncbi:metal-dependent transcriptional regulator [Arcanobacterium pinnipediorum]|uniref:Metal-dependent transcriptional regulator n=1 Tax=Arcanobacterium pinnipediorum TaxID=1503041 RepID=A0ABY5AII2_9ACTO|nr:metal-dependent transcriptional regulator [Arcanobacterium pinnipediorum]USR79246.1 metal-dependent transcriptional regulator [Arcanobacterium pinnipediorum]